jgi:hypothetical protein
MALRSYAFAGDQRLNACLVDHAAHVVEGAVGHHVRKIQAVLEAVDGATIADAEWKEMRYGPTTCRGSRRSGAGRGREAPGVFQAAERL